MRCRLTSSRPSGTGEALRPIRDKAVGIAFKTSGRGFIGDEVANQDDVRKILLSRCTVAGIMIEAATAMTESNEPMHSPDQLKLYPADPPSEHLIIALRLATAKAHEAIEQLPIMRRLTSPTVTHDDYRDYLLAMGRVYRVVEKTLFSGMDDALRERLGLRPKLPAVLLDLEEMGESWPSPGVEAGDFNRDVCTFDLSGTSAIVGGLYTLEGATLGGRTIARQLRRTLGSGLGTARFLDFHGEHTATAWKRFSGVLDELCADGTVVPEEAIHGAIATFDFLHDELGRTSVP